MADTAGRTRINEPPAILAAPYATWVGDALDALEDAGGPALRDGLARAEQRLLRALAPGEDSGGTMPAYLDRAWRGGRERTTQAHELVAALFGAALPEPIAAFIDLEEAAPDKEATVMVVDTLAATPTGGGSRSATLLACVTVRLGGLIAAGEDALHALHQLIISLEDIQRRAN